MRDNRLAALGTLLVSIAGLVLQIASPTKNWGLIGFTLQIAATLFSIFISIAARNIEPRPLVYPGKGAALVLVAAFQVLVLVPIFRTLYTGTGLDLSQGLAQISVVLLLFYPLNEGKLYGPVRRSSTPPVSGAPWLFQLIAGGRRRRPRAPSLSW